MVDWLDSHSTDMTALTVAEIIPGIVAHLDTQHLRTAGGSETNAEIAESGDRAVTDARDFLVVAVDVKRGIATAVPLFTRSSPGSAPLAAAKRVGNTGNWLASDVHYSRWQHWRIPVQVLAAASTDEPSVGDARRGYAVGDADTLQDLANWATRNRCAFRPA